MHRTLVLVSMSADMAWQKKGSGHLYNSKSGHALFVGTKYRKPIALAVLCKECNKCNHGTVHRDDECPRNFVGSSKAMEPEAILRMYVKLYNERKVRLLVIITDDDSSINAIIRQIRRGMASLEQNLMLRFRLSEIRPSKQTNRELLPAAV